MGEGRTEAVILLIEARFTAGDVSTMGIQNAIRNQEKNQRKKQIIAGVLCQFHYQEDTVSYELIGLARGGDN